MDVKKIVIIGGVAGGASAAARLRRMDEHAEIVLLERGPHVSFANCGLPYHIGGEIADRDRLLVATPESLRTRLRLDVRVRSEVTAILRDERQVEVRNLATGELYRERYDAVILSPGAEPLRPALPGFDGPGVLTLRNLEDMDRIIRALDGKRHATVIGGGFIGLEMVEALRNRGIATVLIEHGGHVMKPADPEMAAVLHQELALNGVELRLGISVTEASATPNGTRLTLSTGETLETGLAVLAIGVRPDVALARAAGLELGPRGGIRVNDRMQTCDPLIYAVGDAVEVADFVTGQPALIPLAGPANRQGRIAADNICGREARYRASQGTAICKLFNLAIGVTGLSEKAAKRSGIPVETVHVHAASHASYYPGSAPLSLKVIFDPQTGRLLGAQAVGADGVDKRIDVLATAIRAGLTVYDLEHAELAYAPPYGSAKDPVNLAGFVASNALRGDARLCHAADLIKPAPHQQPLDVRTAEEFAAGTIPGALHIPLDELRDRLQELARDKEYLVFCRVGQRGHQAARILSQNGIACRNLTGGYITYQRTAGTPAPRPAARTTSEPAPHTSTPRTESHTPSMNLTPKKSIDACGLQCPGPILQLKQAMDELRPGEAVAITASDPGFVADAPAWCNTTGHELVSLEPAGKGGYKATVVKRDTAGAACSTTAGSTAAASRPRAMANVVFSSDFDKAMAAFIIANGAAAAGYEVTLFFTFWGINMLRRSGPVTTRKTLIERMFGIMMPKGPDRLSLSKMNMAGMGLALIKGIMKRKNVMSLPELIEQAKQSGVHLVVCTMSMDLMGIKREELIDGIEEGGVARYVDSLSRSSAGLFIA